MRIGARAIIVAAGVHAGPGCRLSPRALLTARGRNVSIGRDCLLSCRFSLDRPQARIRVGDRCFIGASHLVAAEEIILGDDVVISWGVTIVDHDSHALNWRTRSKDVLEWRDGIKSWKDVVIAPVRLESNCWIGFNAILLKGVTVGRGAIVGAGSVVTKDVPDYTVIGGNPARVIREVDDDGA